MWIELFNGPQGLCLKRISADLADTFLTKHTGLTEEQRIAALAEAKPGDWAVTDGQGTGFGLVIKLGAEFGAKSS